MVSPDGRSLYGVSMEADSDSGGKLKFINIDGTNYREYDPPLYAAGGGSTALDVTHGWLGNDWAWYMNDDNSEYLDASLVINAKNGTKASNYPKLGLDDPAGSDVWYGIVGHLVISPSAYFIGNGSGLIAGHGRNYKYMNTKFWSQDPVVRQAVTLAPTQIANHYLFSPDAKWISTGDFQGANPGFIVMYPAAPSSTPIRIARYASVNSTLPLDVSPDCRFSPDGTKLIYMGDALQTGNQDIYAAVLKKPDTPSMLLV